MGPVSTADTFSCPNPAWCVADHARDQGDDHVCSSDDRVLFTGQEGTAVSARLVHFGTDGGPYDGSYVALEHGDLDGLLITHEELRVLIQRLQALDRQLDAAGRPEPPG